MCLADVETIEMLVSEHVYYEHVLELYDRVPSPI